MIVSDVIGSAGVVFMVTAFGLNMIDKLDDDDLLYILMNLLGSFLSCIASYMIDYTPFMILEGIWFMISLWGVYDYMRRNGIKIFKKIS